MTAGPESTFRAGAGTLVLAWGNPARRDDGLGPAFAKAVESAAEGRIDVEIDYQLQVEHADDVARHRRVVFVDAARRGAAPFSLRRLSASEDRPGFSTHSVSPESVLSVSRDVFAAEPEAWLLGIRGYEFGDFGEGLSARARRNLDAAAEFLLRRIWSEESTETGLLPDRGAESEQRGAVR